MADNEGRQRKTHRRHRHLPQRPKKPLSAYTTFLKEYFKTHRPRNAIEAREGMRTASEIWNKKSDKEKRGFAKTGAKERKQYERDMAKWRVQKNLVKRPASSWALFLKATWETERESGRNIGDMSEYASQIWTGMTVAAKGVYLQQHKALAQGYQATMKRLDSGDLKIDSVTLRNIGSLSQPRQRSQQGQLNESDEEEDDEEMEEDAEEADEEMAEDANSDDGNADEDEEEE